MATSTLGMRSGMRVKLLVSRLVTSAESNLAGNFDGFGRRDIYTYFEPAEGLSGLSTESATDKRQSLD